MTNFFIWSLLIHPLASFPICLQLIESKIFLLSLITTFYFLFPFYEGDDNKGIKIQSNDREHRGREEQKSLNNVVLQPLENGALGCDNN